MDLAISSGRPGLVAAVAALSVAVGCGAAAPAAPRRSPSVAPHASPPSRSGCVSRDAIALAVLRQATTFTARRCGPDEVVPWQNHALAMLVESRDAASLREVLADGEPAAQLLALVGLAEVDSATFLAALPSFRGRSESIERMSGCFLSRSTIEAVASEIEAGEARGHVLPEGLWTEPDPEHLEDGRTPAQWLELLAHERTNLDAEIALERSGHHALPALIAGLGHANARVRRSSVEHLRALGPRALTAAGALAWVLEHDPEPDTRARAATALRAVGPWAIDAAPALLRISRSEDAPEDSRHDATRLLEGIARYCPSQGD